MAHKSKVSPVLFVITTLCFLFPFVTVSCNGQKVVTFSGVELATGTTVEQPQVFGPPQKRHQGAQPLATVAALCALAGVGLCFLGLRLAIAPAISGALGALSLLFLQFKLNGDLTKEARSDMFRLDWEAGYILALVFFVVAAAWNFYVFFQGRKSPALASSPPPPLASAAATGAGTSFCPHCGQALNAGARFCGGCGKAVG